MNENYKKIETKALTSIALVTAVMCILGPLSLPIPFSPVPISLTQFGIYLAIYALGYKKGTVATIIYLLLGAVGLPVFSGFGGGFAKLAGPTGGYLIGFILLTLIAGFILEKYEDNVLIVFLGFIIGNAACYILGTLWLGYSTGMTFMAALAAGVIPYIIPDIVKIVISMIVGPQIRKRVYEK